MELGLQEREVAIAKRPRHKAPYLRGGFDEKTGREWQRGPDPSDVTYLEGDERRPKLGPIIKFENLQWAVTSSGLQPLHADSENPEQYDDAYEILAADLVRKQNFGTLYFWPVQVAKEPWVDIDAFEEAFREALRIHAHACKPRVDEEILRASIRRAREILQRR